MDKIYSILFATLFISSSALAQWELVNNESTLNFVSVKKSTIAEAHHFQSIKGTIDDNGNIAVTIDLESVETNISIRNDRLKSMLFQVSKFPKASIKATIEPKKLANMDIGDSMIHKTTLKTSLHGVSDQISTDIRVIKLKDNKLLAASINPIIINTDKYKLTAGVELLRKAAKLSSISTAIPVSFSFTFTN